MLKSVCGCVIAGWNVRRQYWFSYSELFLKEKKRLCVQINRPVHIDSTCWVIQSQGDI